MTPEIDRLRAEYEAKDSLARDARDAARSALGALNAAVAAWATTDLAARQIEIGVTRVNGAKQPWRGEGDVRWHSGEFLVMRVSASDGWPSYQLAKIKKDGTASSASNGIWDQIVAVRKAKG